MSDIKRQIHSVAGRGDILLIVPPFVTTRTPVLGPHILQSIAGEQGFKADILYLNLLLASIIGVDKYESISYGQPYRMTGERLFARSAYGLPPMGKSPEMCFEPALSVFGDTQQYPVEEFEHKYYKTVDFDLDAHLKIEELCHSLIEEVSLAIASLDYKIVGCSSNWEQNNCCIALINRLKRLQPDLITLMGGSNCEGQMAEGIASLSDSTDYFFSGESEEIFATFLKNHQEGKFPAGRIIIGQPLENLDSLPSPDYDTYFKQIKCFFNDNPLKGIAIPYETSRGCWYHKCSFCGMNGKRGHFRQKTVEKVSAELGKINDRSPENGILFIDKLMSPTYQEQLLPLLAENNGAMPITCEHRPTPDLRDLMNLKKSGINVVKFGIESLSTGLLKLMNKGITAAENILLLRNASISGIYVDWHLLWGFPGDKVRHYQEILNILPLLRHLCPPSVFRHVSLDRFSPYFETAQDFEINCLRPWATYQAVYPDWADIDKLAYRFIGDYPCEAHEHPELIKEIAEEVINWGKNWKMARLVLVPFADYYILYDSRGIGKKKNHMLNAFQTREIMTYSFFNDSESQKWAVDQKLGVVVDSRYIPLVTASPGLLLEYEKEI